MKDGLETIHSFILASDDGWEYRCTADCETFTIELWEIVFEEGKSTDKMAKREEFTVPAFVAYKLFSESAELSKTAPSGFDD